MDTKTRKSSPRLSAPPPGVLGFAEGGVVPETADELMARMTAKYGAPAAGPAQAAPVQLPAPQPQTLPQQQGLTGGIVSLLKGRAAQIDKAVNGYANGGKIEGPGTPTSDSIDAQVSETGEPIQVSTDERIVSKAQGQFLESVAKNAGYESLDAMLEDGTGKPVGPTIKGGKRAAAGGLSPETDPDTDGRRQYSPGYGDAFAYRGGNGDSARTETAIAAPPTLGAAPLARSEPAGVLTGPASGITADPFGPSSKAGSGLTGIAAAAADVGFATGAKPGVPPVPAQGIGRDPSGVITADSAQAAMGNDMQRSGGVFGGIDMAGVNGIMARENKARGEMIDASIKANGGNGVAILGDGTTEADKINAERTQRWAVEDMADAMKRAGTRTERAALGHAMNTMLNNQMQQRGQDMNYAAEIGRQGITARGQDLNSQSDLARNQITMRGQDINANTDAQRIASDESIAGARITERSGLTLSQQRGNAEIGAARERIAGLTPDEIKRKTQQFSATGRENPDFDQTLALAVKQANRRMVGDDQDFDSRQQAQQSVATNEHGYDRADVAKRFRSERAMDSHRLGNDTPNGVEVLDSSGKVIGHYR